MSAAVVIMAKAPAAGRSKTRLCPPCTPDQAADLAAACLLDTIDAVDATATGRRVLALDVPQERWTPPGYEVIVQRGDGLAQRLSEVVRDVDEPLVIVGMDTPQATPALLSAIADRTASTTEPLLGLACDGGWWVIGLPSPRADVFDGVAMSRSDTGCEQRRRLVESFGSVSMVDTLRDVDHWSDALEVAGAAPHTRLARAVRVLESHHRGVVA